jgi:AraC-like DNA-binding protein
MNFFTMSRLARLNVKWVNLHIGNKDLYMVNHSNGETFMLNPWEQHSGWKESLDTASFFWVQFECDPPLTEFNEWTPSNKELNILHTPKNELRTIGSDDLDNIILQRSYKPELRYQVLSLFEKLLYEFNRPQGYYRFRLSLLLGSILETIANDLLEHNLKDIYAPTSFITYRKLISYLNEKYYCELTKEIIEKETNRKYEYLCQIFKKNAGFTIHAYIQKLRIQRAKYLLMNSNKNINLIAEEIGYQDALYFSKIFKKTEGTSPSSYRLIKQAALD